MTPRVFRLRRSLIVGSLLLIGSNLAATDSAEQIKPDAALPVTTATPAEDAAATAIAADAATQNGSDSLDSVAEDPPPPPRNPQQELADAQSLYSAAFAAEQYPQALIAAGQMVTLTGEINGIGSIEHALAISDLANAQSRAGDLASAAANYKQAILLIEEQQGIVAPELVKPLMGLAAAQNALGEWDRGLETYNRALRINHVELGLNNIDQMPIRDGMTESFLGLGSIADANFQQEIQLRIVRDEFGKDLNKLVLASNKLADWYGKSNQQEKEVWQREMTVSTIRNNAGQDATEQIQELRDLAAAYQKLDLPQDTELNAYNAAIGALQEASRINNESATPDQLLSAELQIETGDVHNFYGSPRDARRYYQDAWQTLVAADASEDVFDGLFDQPTLIGTIRLPAAYPDDSETRQLWNSAPDRFQPGFLQALIDINDNGRTENIRITESSPKDLLDDRALYLLKRYKYRPRFEQGQPVATRDFPISHAFSYLPEGQDDAGQNSDENDEEVSDPLDYPEADN